MLPVGFSFCIKYRAYCKSAACIKPLPIIDQIMKCFDSARFTEGLNAKRKHLWCYDMNMSFRGTCTTDGFNGHAVCRE